jgi:ribokinase
MGVLVFGSLSMDVTAYVPRLPQPGETLFGRTYGLSAGGKGANQAVASARLGCPTRFVGRVGQDLFGPGARSGLMSSGVDVSGLSEDPEHGTGLAIISVDEAAENAIIVVSGANMALDDSDVQRGLDHLAECTILMLQLEVPMTATQTLARAAHQRGVTVILDPAPARALADDFLRTVDIITPNEVEAEALVGFPVETVDDAKRAASALVERGVGAAVLKLGERGAVVQTGDTFQQIPPFEVEAVDTVAAGDAFNGGLAAGLHAGLPLLDALRWGSAAGALAVTRRGAAASMPDRRAFDALLKRGLNA